MLYPANIPLRIQIVQFPRCFTTETAGFEFLLDPAAFLAKGVCVIARGAFVDTHAFGVAEMSFASGVVGIWVWLLLYTGAVGVWLAL